MKRPFFGVLLAFVTFVAAGQASSQLHFREGVVYVSGLATTAGNNITDKEWREILSVYTHEAFVRDIQQPVAGKYTLTPDGLSFEPAFSFSSGTTYHAVFSSDAFLKITGQRLASLSGKTALTFNIPVQQHSRTSVVSVSPESEVVPENLLRMYITFSAPMMPGELYNYIKLINKKGQLVERAFLVVDQELWNPERRQVTILFDPGRIKRGLKSNLDLGTPLKEGERYELVIDSAWRDLHGNALSRSFRKDLVVGPAQRTKLSTNGIRISAPLEASREPVIISFDRLIDHSLALRFVSVEMNTQAIEGEFRLVNDSTLKFTPALPWQSGTYTLSISPLLEDVSGNNFKNAFDLDLTKEQRVFSNDLVKIEFVARPRRND